MDPLNYVKSFDSTTWRDDLSILWRAARQRVVTSAEEKSSLQRYYVAACCRGLVWSIPAHLYRLTQIFLAIIACQLAHSTGNSRLVSMAKFRANQVVIDMAFSSLEMTVLPLGMVFPEEALALHSVQRLALRSSVWTNDRIMRTSGFPKVEKGIEPIIYSPALKSALRAHLLRICDLVKLIIPSIILAMTPDDPQDRYQQRLQRVVNLSLRVAKHEMDIPRCELAMAFPSLDGARAQAVVAFCHRLICVVVDKQLQGLSMGQIFRQAVWARLQA